MTKSPFSVTHPVDRDRFTTARLYANSMATVSAAYRARRFGGEDVDTEAILAPYRAAYEAVLAECEPWQRLRLRNRERGR